MFSMGGDEPHPPPTCMFSMGGDKPHPPPTCMFSMGGDEPHPPPTCMFSMGGDKPHPPPFIFLVFLQIFFVVPNLYFLSIYFISLVNASHSLGFLYLR